MERFMNTELADMHRDVLSKTPPPKECTLSDNTEQTKRDEKAKLFGNLGRSEFIAEKRMTRDLRRRPINTSVAAATYIHRPTPRS
ncbi:hypothetical protein TNCV_85791 [Trichonephila clavipes]|nr:hypothetical protein TNCV_85791 [Trichonephila clavipes]